MRLGFLLGAIGLTAAVSVGATWRMLSPSPADAPVVGEVHNPSKPQAVQAKAARPQPPALDMRARIDQAFALRGERFVAQGRVDDYLDELENQARDAGRVGALEVEPGIRALMASGADPDDIAAFERRMAELSLELDGRTEAPPSTPPADDELARRLEGAPDDGTRHQIIGEALDAARDLEAEAAAEALSRVDELAGAPVVPQVPLPHEDEADPS